MKFRIFYAPESYKTWEKLFVLTSDGKLFCEYLYEFNLRTIEETNIKYEEFIPQDYSWGKGVRGDNGVALTNYQTCEKEISWIEYINLKPSSLLSKYNNSTISKQIRWVQNYLSSIGLDSSNWDSEFYDKLNK